MWPTGPLHGLPVTVKDRIDVAGRLRAGETTDRTRRPHPPSGAGRDGPLAATVDALEQALAVLAGPDGWDPAAASVPLRASSR